MVTDTIEFAKRWKPSRQKTGHIRGSKCGRYRIRRNYDLTFTVYGRTELGTFAPIERRPDWLPVRHRKFARAVEAAQRHCRMRNTQPKRKDS